MLVSTQYPKQVVPNRSLLTKPTSASLREHARRWGEAWIGPSPWSLFSRCREDRVTGLTPSCLWESGVRAESSSALLCCQPFCWVAVSGNRSPITDISSSCSCEVQIAFSPWVLICCSGVTTTSSPWASRTATGVGQRY
ncbi:hypothetical protein AB205_0076270, partial [Aquarana catesbeiana]